MEVPAPDFSVNDVIKKVGENHVIDVLEDDTQKVKKMKFREFAKYYNEEASRRKKQLNAIPLEVSEHGFKDIVRPRVINSLDWIDLCWPKHLRWCPKVKKYCLMSVKGCYTDFHVNFGGTSVWYYIVRGRKMFWLIRPCGPNLRIYEAWLGYHDKKKVFFPDLVNECQLVTLEQGMTFMIPSGWIHGVYTQEDSLVFGGNFLHSLDMPMQIRIAESEVECKVDVESRFPHLDRLLWYVLDRYAYQLTGTSFMSENYKRANHVVEDEVEGQVREKKYLTRCEYGGLSVLIRYLRGRAGTKNYEIVGIPDLNALLKRADQIVKDHQDDDAALAITGQPVVFWNNKNFNDLKSDLDAQTAPPITKTEDTAETTAEKIDEPDKPAEAARGSEHITTDKRTNRKNTDETNEPVRTSKKIKPDATGGTRKKRAKRCKKCDACKREDCQKCANCKDMKKYGGPGLKKQCCKYKKCTNLKYEY